MEHEIINTLDYVKKLSAWCKENDKPEFYHHELPDHLKNGNKRWLTRAANMGYLKRVSVTNTSCVILWKIRKHV